MGLSSLRLGLDTLVCSRATRKASFSDSADLDFMSLSWLRIMTAIWCCVRTFHVVMGQLSLSLFEPSRAKRVFVFCCSRPTHNLQPLVCSSSEFRSATVAEPPLTASMLQTKEGRGRGASRGRGRGAAGGRGGGAAGGRGAGGRAPQDQGKDDPKAVEDAQPPIHECNAKLIAAMTKYIHAIEAHPVFAGVANDRASEIGAVDSLADQDWQWRSESGHQSLLTEPTPIPATPPYPPIHPPTTFRFSGGGPVPSAIAPGRVQS